MTSREAAARFAAFTWYTECRRGPSHAVQTGASRFAEENWQAFLPLADEGWGRLLLHVAKTGKEREHRSAVANRSTKRHLAAAD
jgi:hypothetical protein